VNWKKILALFCCFAWGISARAHTPGLSTLKIQHRDGQITAVLIFSTAEMQSILPLDANSDGAISSQEFSVAQNTLEKLAKNLLQLSIDGKPLALVESKFSQDENDNLQFDLKYAPQPGGKLEVVSKWIGALPPGHRQFVAFQEGAGQPVTEDLLDSDSNVFTVELAQTARPISSSAKKQYSFTEFLILGIEHILTGYDHLLFLFGLLIVCHDFKSIIKIISCFTLAHSLTLALATLNIVQIPSRVIEPAIAASIVYVGVENIFRHGQPKGRWILTFAFGLVHGFGFASVLREMEIAKAGSVVIPLVSFNLGVEIGQIAVAALILPIFWFLRKRPVFDKGWVPACSALVAAAGTFWFIQRVWF
jgi:hydrogenase/urease accessory protein HupE